MFISAVHKVVKIWYPTWGFVHSYDDQWLGHGVTQLTLNSAARMAIDLNVAPNTGHNVYLWTVGYSANEKSPYISVYLELKYYPTKCFNSRDFSHLTRLSGTYDLIDIRLALLCIVI